ncbi:LysR family transcriptional regulator [Ancylobacter radicis]|uniref:LysR family transcriptional regulator n=1 Tax=Ancylobacter radicis TaxID=2836179 RepID=A0ABS5R9P6_9HYPH|nr:LysR family transcriptional regulator [Ancylobacter radicis]MBS9478391.1 LysR family transcriptional regulator [Ancylobacter radicis]
MRKIRLILPSMNGFFTFEAAARCGNFARAAEELNVTPAAVSRMVGRLEEHIGVSLFDRLPGGVALTEAGRILHEAIGRGFSGIERALQEIEDRRIGIETVTLSVSTGFTTHWMMPHMAELKRDFPKLELRFQLIMTALGGPVHDVDLGMRFLDRADPRHEASYIMPEIVLPVCSPSYAETGRSVSAVRRTIRLIRLSEAEPDWSNLVTPEPGAPAPETMDLDDYAIVVQAAMLGQGVALGWLNVVCHWLRTGALVPAGPRATASGRHCQFLRLRDKPLRPIVADLRDWIITRLRADLDAVAERYDDLGLAPLLRNTM